MTILVINNYGGAIFSLLPIADRTDPRLLNQFFYTSHNISIQKLCMAHGYNLQHLAGYLYLKYVCLSNVMVIMYHMAYLLLYIFSLIYLLII